MEREQRTTKAISDVKIIALISVVSYFIFGQYDVLEKIVEFSAQYEEYEVDELISTLIVFSFGMMWFSLRRWRETMKYNKELQHALSTLRKLEGILPICMHCKEIRDEHGSWNQIETYISEHSEAQFSHSVCDKCLKKHYLDPT